MSIASPISSASSTSSPSGTRARVTPQPTPSSTSSPSSAPSRNSLPSGAQSRVTPPPTPRSTPARTTPSPRSAPPRSTPQTTPAPVSTPIPQRAKPMVFRDRVAPESGPLSRRAAYEFVKKDLYGRAFYLNVNNTVPYPVRGRYRGNIDGEAVESGDLDCTATALAGTQSQFSSAVLSMAESVSRMADSYKDLNDDGTEFKIGTRIYEKFHRDGQI